MSHFYIGIDVSSQHLQVTILDQHETTVACFGAANNTLGWRSGAASRSGCRR